mmetsp:Transcript_58373/g.173940  ORF Transcript_58373/g.173940 Transcript_58373/m.173940 type:complete len:305 (-) Transcript_58373:1548-2462(-)
MGGRGPILAGHPRGRRRTGEPRRRPPPGSDDRGRRIGCLSGRADGLFALRQVLRAEARFHTGGRRRHERRGRGREQCAPPKEARRVPLRQLEGPPLGLGPALPSPHGRRLRVPGGGGHLREAGRRGRSGDDAAVLRGVVHVPPRWHGLEPHHLLPVVPSAAPLAEGDGRRPHRRRAVQDGGERGGRGCQRRRRLRPLRRRGPHVPPGSAHLRLGRIRPPPRVPPGVGVPGGRVVRDVQAGGANVREGVPEGGRRAVGLPPAQDSGVPPRDAPPPRRPSPWSVPCHGVARVVRQGVLGVRVGREG